MVEKESLEVLRLQFLQLFFCFESSPVCSPALGACQGRFPTSQRMGRSNPATTPQVPEVDLKFRPEQDRLLLHRANSRTVSKVALIPLPQVPQGRVVDPRGCYNVVGCGEVEKLRAKAPALFEHEANTVIGTKHASPLPAKSEQLEW